MKKLIGVLFAALLFTALGTTALALSEPAAQADSLHTLGLMEGVGTSADGGVDYDLGRVPTRAEAVTMLVRLLGQDAAAKAGDWTTPFTDVPVWAAPYVGYAYENGLTNGVGDGIFGSAQPATEQHYATFLLRALGYSEAAGDFTYAAALDKASAAGILGGGGDFTRSVLVGDSYRALCAAVKGGERTLANKLLWDDVFTTGQLADTRDAKMLIAADMPDYIPMWGDEYIVAETKEEVFDLLRVLLKGAYYDYGVLIKTPFLTYSEIYEMDERLSAPGDYALGSHSDGSPIVRDGVKRSYTTYGVRGEGDFLSVYFSPTTFGSLMLYYQDPARVEKNKLFHEGVEYTDSDGGTWTRYAYALTCSEFLGDDSVDLVAETERILAGTIKPGMTDRQKYEALNAYLCDMLRYEKGAANSLGLGGDDVLYAAFHDKKAVCAGYAYAYMALCRAAGLECELAYGYVPNGDLLDEYQTTNHVWNQVCLDGRWYNVDVTWNDTGPSRTRYLFKSDAFMKSERHQVSVNGTEGLFTGSAHACAENL